MTDIDTRWGKVAFDTVTYKITVPSSMQNKFEHFLSLLVRNGGHSGTFGLHFDGDGMDWLEVEPGILRFPGVGAIGGSGSDFEIATGEGYTGFFRDVTRDHPGGELVKIPAQDADKR